MERPKTDESTVIVCGAGLAGSLLACYLAKKGLKVDLYEYRDDMRKHQMSAGRSINLALSERGFNALEKVGLKDEIMKIAIPMRGRKMHSKTGELTFQPYSKDEKSSIFSVSRGELNCRLMTLAETNPNVKIYFNQKCSRVDLRTGEISFQDMNTKEYQVVKPLTTLATDGAFSAARKSLMYMPRFEYSQTYLTHGYKELVIPPGPNGEHVIDKHCLHIWPRGSFMMIALPNLDGSFTCTCFFPFEGPSGFDELDKHPEKVMDFFRAEFPDAVPIMPTLLHDFQNNPTSALVTVRCFPWSLSDKVCLLGDAAHAIVPFFGQGMNAAFEDCFYFGELLESHGTSDWLQLFTEFQNLRKENADAIADLALENFVEMRDKVADPEFLFKSKVLALLGKTFPEKFRSRYEMVSFTRIPYKDALKFGNISDEIARELIRDAGEQNLDKIDLKKAEKLIDERLKELHLHSRL